jgi:hypothetical protein
MGTPKPDIHQQFNHWHQSGANVQVVGILA